MKSDRFRGPFKHRKALPDGDAVGMSQPAAPRDRAPPPPVAMVQPWLPLFPDGRKGGGPGQEKGGGETPRGGVGGGGPPPASTGMRLSCDAPETGRVTATMDRPSGENRPGRPSPS